MSDQSITSWIRHPASIILIIVLAIMFLMFADQSKQKEVSTTESNIMSPPATAPVPVMPSGQASAPMGGDLPKIVKRLGAPPMASAPGKAAPGSLAAPDLGSLLKRLEDKVKAEPGNINNRLLLAQTYNELDLAEKALTEAREAIKQFPDHTRVKLVLASILSKRKDETELNEAVVLLNGLKGIPDVKQYLVEMYLGDAWIRLGNHQSAHASWKLALDSMPVGDNRRAKIEKNITELSNVKSGV